MRFMDFLLDGKDYLPLVQERSFDGLWRSLGLLLDGCVSAGRTRAHLGAALAQSGSGLRQRLGSCGCLSVFEDPARELRHQSVLGRGAVLILGFRHDRPNVPLRGYLLQLAIAVLIYRAIVFHLHFTRSSLSLEYGRAAVGVNRRDDKGESGDAC